MRQSPADYLTDLDAFFVYIESDRAPMHIGTVNIYEGRIPHVRYRNYLAERLGQLRRYRQRLVEAPLNLAHPRWEDDPAFDIRNHVHKIDLPPRASVSRLRKLAEKLASERLPRDRPLWAQYIVHGLEKNRSAIITKVHHCMADGVASVQLLFLMFDDSNDAVERTGAAVESWPRRGRLYQFASALAANLRNERDRLNDIRHSAGRVLTRNPGAGLVSTIRTGAVTLSRYALCPAPPLYAANTLSGTKKLAWCAFSLEELKDASRRLGGSVNDALLTIVSGGLAHYGGAAVSGAPTAACRAIIPVNVRRGEHTNALGNRVSVWPVLLPLSLSDPTQAFDAIHAQTAALRTANFCEGIHIVFRGLQAMAPPIQARVGKLLHESATLPPVPGSQSQPWCQAVCTNVHGPDAQVATLGRRLVAVHPFMPTLPHLGVGFACVSYAGKLYVSIVADARVLPTIYKLKIALERSHMKFVDASVAR